MATKIPLIDGWDGMYDPYTGVDTQTDGGCGLGTEWL